MEELWGRCLQLAGSSREPEKLIIELQYKKYCTDTFYGYLRNYITKILFELHILEINITYILKEFANLFISLKLSTVTQVALDSRKDFSAEDFRTVIKPSVELAQVILLKKKSGII